MRAFVRVSSFEAQHCLSEFERTKRYTATAAPLLPAIKAHRCSSRQSVSSVAQTTTDQTSCLLKSTKSRHCSGSPNGRNTFLL